jgi:hypothetical protein
VPTIGEGGCLGRGWWWRELKGANKPPAVQNVQNSAKNWRFLAFSGLNIAEKAVFHSKVLNKIYSQDVF